MSEDRPRGGGGSYIAGGPLLVGLLFGAGLGTLICKLGGLNYACLMKKLRRFMCTPEPKKCAAGAAVAVAGAGAGDKPAETPPPAKAKA